MKPKTIFLSGLAFAVIGATAVTVMNTVAPQTAAAQTSSAKMIVDQAIRDGKVGETASGYLALVTGGADQKVINAMNEVNIGRKSVYTKLARAQNVQVEVVAAVTGEKQIARSPRGSKVLTAQGMWITVK